MSPSVFALVLFSAALHATWNLLIKRSSDKLLMTTSVTMSAGVAGLLALPFFPAPSEASWVFIGASAVMSVAYFLMVSATYNVADMSLAYPIIRGSAPLIIGLAGMVLFGEYLPLTAWMAIIIISAGILSMAWPSRSTASEDCSSHWPRLCSQRLARSLTLKEPDARNLRRLSHYTSSRARGCS